MYANEPGSQTQCDALNEIIRLRDVKIAQLEKQIANKLQPRIDELEVENKMLRRGMGPIGEKVRT